MEKKRDIAQYREKLNKTLTSSELTNDETLKILIKNQTANSAQNKYEGYADNIIEKRTSEISTFLDMLRSASVNDHQLSKSTEAATQGEWKLKDDSEEYRVMYREGPEGTPFHTLLVEGYMDGPVDVCLCVCLESEFYRKWWPQSNIPPFKLAISKCLQRVQLGEQISLMRVKLMWPLSSREAVVHFFVFEYLQDGLIVCLMNTIPDLQSIDKSTHGYTTDGIPEAKDVVRIDVVGGFALQKVSPKRSYIRTIANMDIKLDFVPPSLINFVARQLIGSGFRLYNKSVKSVSNNGEDYSAAMRDPLYTHIREALYSIDKPDEISDGKEHDLRNVEQKTDPAHDHKIKFMPANAEISVKKDVCEIKEEPTGENGNTNKKDENRELEIQSDDQDSPNNAQAMTENSFGEIEEEESEEYAQIIDSRKPLANKNVIIRPEVEQALGILDKAISRLRQYGFNEKNISSSDDISKVERLASYDSEKKEKTPAENSNGEVLKNETIEKTSCDSINSSRAHESRKTLSSSFSREVNHNKIAPASQEEYFSIPIDTDQIYLCSSKNWTNEISIPHHNGDINKQISAVSNNSHGNTTNEVKKIRLCCFFG